MPLYEYACQSCHKVTEVIQKFSDPELTECRDCGGKLEKLLSAPAIQFKGSGWYITDYAKSGSSQAANRKDSQAGDKSSEKPADKSPSNKSAE